MRLQGILAPGSRKIMDGNVLPAAVDYSGIIISTRYNGFFWYAFNTVVHYRNVCKIEGSHE